VPTSSSSTPPWLDKYVAVIDSRVSELFGTGGSTLELAVKGALDGGKRVRAVLALLWCEAISGGYEEAVPVAVAYELAREVRQVNTVVDVLVREGTVEQVVMGVIGG